MNKSKNVICPSSTCKAGSNLLGIVKEMDMFRYLTSQFLLLKNLLKLPIWVENQKKDSDLQIIVKILNVNNGIKIDVKSSIMLLIY